MSEFITPLILRDDGGLPLTVVDSFIYRSDLLKQWISVPVGFKTDLASIPRFFWRVLPPIGRYDKPAVIHDWLYHTNGMSRLTADKVLREAMEVTHVPAWQRALIFRAVRLGGWVPWNKYRQKEQKSVNA